MSDPAAVDPVLARRARIASLVALGKRLGYGLFAVAVVTFIVGSFTNFGGLTGSLIVFSIVVGSIILAPAIVFGYGVKAAERDERGEQR